MPDEQFEAIQFKAEWVPDREQMVTTMLINGQQYTQAYDRDGWRDFIARLGHEPLTVGGVVVTMEGQAEKVDNVIATLHDYLRRVDYAFRHRGRTDRIPTTLPRE